MLAFTGTKVIILNIHNNDNATTEKELQLPASVFLDLRLAAKLWFSQVPYFYIRANIIRLINQKIVHPSVFDMANVIVEIEKKKQGFVFVTYHYR